MKKINNFYVRPNHQQQKIAHNSSINDFSRIETNKKIRCNRWKTKKKLVDVNDKQMDKFSINCIIDLNVKQNNIITN